MSRFIIKPSQPNFIEQLRRLTPARLGGGRAGVRPTTTDWIVFRRDHALAKDAVKSEFSQELLAWAFENGYPVIQSLASSKAEFIAFPPQGKQTDADTIAQLARQCPVGCDVQIVISDGLSARAIEHNIQLLLSTLLNRFSQAGISYGMPVVVRYGRVRIADQICQGLQAKLAINLIGERPGLSASDSLSAYLTYRPTGETLSAQRTVVSNIHRFGSLPQEAACQIAALAATILHLKLSGVELQHALNSRH